jgi:hypothetical protein
MLIVSAMDNSAKRPQPHPDISPEYLITALRFCQQLLPSPLCQLYQDFFVFGRRFFYILELKNIR